MPSFEQIKKLIIADEANKEFTAKGWQPLYSVHKEAKILIVGQAPGIKAQESGIFWNDPSGDRLREWLGMNRETFYHSRQLAILPMDFYFPGKGKSGDLPPRKDIADAYHPMLLANMPEIELTILIGAYAQSHYLGLGKSIKITELVKDYKIYLPDYFPLVHPSPRNNIWLKKNPWFEEEVIPDLQGQVKRILK